jgi:hypothetical protein
LSVIDLQHEQQAQVEEIEKVETSCPQHQVSLVKLQINY